VYAFIRQYMENTDRTPSYDEIRQYFGFASFQSVQKHLKQLERKGLSACRGRTRSGRSRSRRSEAKRPSVPFGVVAAGRPIEAVEAQETVAVPEEMVGPETYFALLVRGSP